jgi:hypothetical protein
VVSGEMKHAAFFTPMMPRRLQSRLQAPQPSRRSFLACVGAASQRTPNEDGSPRVLRRRTSELSPRSWISKIFVSGASRTSPTVLRPAAMSACCTFGGSSTFAMDMSSGSSGDGSIMASFFPLTAVLLSACKASFGCALKDETASLWDLRRAFGSSGPTSGLLAIPSESRNCNDSLLCSRRRLEACT